MKFLNATLLCLFLMLPVWHAGYCQQKLLHFNTLTFGDGLPEQGHYNHQSILQSRDGFMWFSTPGGLCRFDGVGCKNYYCEPSDSLSISSNHTTAILEAPDGKIWIGTSTDGINMFDPATGLFTRYDQSKQDASGFSGKGVAGLRADQEGHIWIATRFNGICRWNKDTGTFSKVADEDAREIFLKNDGSIWIGIQNGLQQYQPQSGTLKTFSMDNTQSQLTRSMIDLQEMPDGHIWMTSSVNGLWDYDPVAETFTDLSGRFAFKNAPTAMLWDGICGWHLPVNWCNMIIQKDWSGNTPATWGLTLPGASITDLFKDRTGNLWCMTADNGVAYSNELNSPFEQIARQAFLEIHQLDENRMLVRTINDGAWVFDAATNNYTRSDFPILKNWNFTSSLLVADGKLFISEGAQHPFKCVDLETGAVRELPALGLALRFAGNRIWNGPFYLQEPAGEWVNALPELRESVPAFVEQWAYITDIRDAGDSAVWFGTLEGLFRYDFRNKTHRHFVHHPGDPNSLITNSISHLFSGDSGRLYILTDIGMSIYLPEKDSFVNLVLKDGSRRTIAQTVVEDHHGHAWIGTTTGLRKYDFATETITSYSVEDGMPAESCYYQLASRDGNGTIYFGADDKLIRFHPDSIPERRQTAPVHITDFFLNHQLVKNGDENRVLEKEVQFTGAITLQPDQADFGFAYTMPFFYKPAEVVYYYRLFPYQKEWQPAGIRREVHFTNIEPGNYLFEVKAQTPSGVWSENTAALQVKLLPPWYETLWAKCLFVALVAGAVYWFYRFNLKRQMEKQESIRLRDLDHLKTRLYTNITHEFRTPLTVIMGMNDNIEGHEKEKNLIKRNAKNLLSLINQLLDLSKLDSGTMKMDTVQGDIIRYLQYLAESFYSMATDKKVRLRFTPQTNALVMDFDEVKVQHIVHNLLSNAIKFTSAGGEVELIACETSQHNQPFLKITIRDTGIGIPAHDLPRIFDRFYQVDTPSDGTISPVGSRTFAGTGIGLAFTKELVELMGGQIQVRSKEGEGTEFDLLLPVKQAAHTPVMEKGTYAKPSENEMPESLSVATESEDEGKPQILVIEDNAGVVTYIESLLQNDYSVQVAVNGQAGIDKALEQVPDLIISDVMMPEKNGYEVCRFLKNDERTSHIPIILLTAKADMPSKIEGLEMGADAYLNKPFEKPELMVRIRKLLELRRKLQERYGKVRDFPGIRPGMLEEHPGATPFGEDAFFEKLNAFLETRYADEEMTIPEISQALLMSPIQLYRKLKALTGKTPSQYLRSFRLQKATELLKTTGLSVSEVAYSVGFSDPNYFSRVFKQEFGKVPGEV